MVTTELPSEDSHTADVPHRHPAGLPPSISAADESYALALFYDKLLPIDLLYSWLTYSREGNPASFARREFSFSSTKSAGEEIYIRWLSFSNGAELKRRLLSMTPIPHKFDIGPVFSHPVSKRNSILVEPGDFYPVERELVIDIDMSDYNDVRTCCAGKSICNKCWTFLAVAVEVLEPVFRDDFGFRHILWVFSGRRGIHGWICDPEARKLTSEERSNVAQYLNLISGSANQQKRVKLPRIKGGGNALSPFARRAYEKSLPLFGKILREQNIFRRGSPMEAKVDAYMDSCAPRIRAEYLKRKESWSGTSIELWSLVLNCCIPKDPVTPAELLFSICYPRLDINVTKEIGHLLKAPFCIHYATGSLCIPLRRDKIHKFDPATVPSLRTLRQEFLEGGSCIEKTSLQGFIDHFKKDFLEPLLLSTTQEQGPSANQPLTDGTSRAAASLLEELENSLWASRGRIEICNSTSTSSNYSVAKSSTRTWAATGSAVGRASVATIEHW